MQRLAALAAFKLSLYVKEQGNENLFETYSQLLVRDLTEEKAEGFEQAPGILFADEPQIAFRYGKLCRLLKNNPIALTAVQLYMLVCMDRRTLSLLEESFGMRQSGPTIEEAWSVLYRMGSSIDQIHEIYEAYELVKFVLLAKDEGGDFLKNPLQPDPYLAAWLCGEDGIDYRLRPECYTRSACEALEKPVTAVKEIARAASFLQEAVKEVALYVSGEKGIGRRFFVCQTAKKAGYHLLFVPYDRLVRQEQIAESFWSRVLRQCLLEGRALCIYDMTAREGETACAEAVLKRIEKDYRRTKLPLFLTGDGRVKPAAVLKQTVFTVELSEYTTEESVRLWRHFAEVYLPQAENFPAELLACGMHLTAGQMKKLMRYLACREEEKQFDVKEIFRLCYQVLDDGRYENVTRIPCTYTWEDLKIPSYSRQLLMDICNQARYQLTVLNQWEMRKRITYGRSISALFSGPPGTGKTMAAQVIASELGMEIYRIDLSQVTDKYIGETEKRLKDIFGQAEKSNMILLFDEADALFGKRSDVSDAKDKYANTEVAYLLQKIEEYRGIVLMTTNLVSNIDSAFIRRFRYHVPFHMPGKALRLELWKDMLKDPVPKEGIDFDYLAGQFKFSGAQIKNVALNACYKAAASGGAVKMEHLVEAVFQEGQKEGKLMLTGEFGIYGKLLTELLKRIKEEKSEENI